jgi:hypothetical protein
MIVQLFWSSTLYVNNIYLYKYRVLHEWLPNYEIWFFEVEKWGYKKKKLNGIELKTTQRNVWVPFRNDEKQGFNLCIEPFAPESCTYRSCTHFSQPWEQPKAARRLIIHFQHFQWRSVYVWRVWRPYNSKVHFSAHKYYINDMYYDGTW